MYTHNKTNYLKITLYLPPLFILSLLTTSPTKAMLSSQAPKLHRTAQYLVPSLENKLTRKMLRQAPNLASQSARALAPALERKLAHDIHTQALALTQRTATPQEQADFCTYTLNAAKIICK